MGFFDVYYNVPCTVWSGSGGFDEYGNAVLSAPIHGMCGVNEKAVMVVDKSGKEVQSASQLLMGDEYSENSWFLIGSHSDSLTPDTGAKQPIAIKPRRLVMDGKILGWWYML